MSEQEEQAKILKAKKATPEIKSWHEYALSSKHREPERLEDAAKYLVGIISVCITLFLQNTPDVLASQTQSMIVAAGIMFWLVALILAFVVIRPKKYPYIKQSAQSIQEMHEKVIHFKNIRLNVSIVFFVIGLLLLVAVFLINIFN